MTPKEMHIGVDLEAQKVNSNYIAAFEPEEKDWFLTSEMFRYIKRRVREDLEDGQKRYDDLQAIIETASLNVHTKDDKSIFAFLPVDYLYLLNDRSITKDLCGATYAPATSADNFYTSCLVLPTNSYEFWKTFKIIKNSVVVFNTQDYFPNGLSSNDASFELINAIIDVFNVGTIFEAKYENYKGIYCRGGIILSSNTSFTLEIEYKINISTTFSAAVGVTLHNLLKINSITGSSEWPNRLSRNDNDYTLLLSTNFGTSFHYSPISVIQQNQLIVRHNKKFIVSNLNINYFRRPKKISLSLNQACELSEDVHEEIVVATAKRLAGITLSDGYRNLINESLLKE